MVVSLQEGRQYCFTHVTWDAELYWTKAYIQYSDITRRRMVTATAATGSTSLTYRLNCLREKEVFPDTTAEEERLTPSYLCQTATAQLPAWA